MVCARAQRIYFRTRLLAKAKLPILSIFEPIFAFVIFMRNVRQLEKQKKTFFFSVSSVSSVLRNN